MSIHLEIVLRARRTEVFRGASLGFSNDLDRDDGSTALMAKYRRKHEQF